jgi:hypothetical protein
MSELKTSKEWQAIHAETIVLDPDGWDRENFDYSWKEELITEDEYFKRRIVSTCRIIME